jgi:hypothetical protein
VPQALPHNGKRSTKCRWQLVAVTGAVAEGKIKSGQRSWWHAGGPVWTAWPSR